MKNYNFYIFDIDGTLCDRDSTELYPNVLEWFLANAPKEIGLATNQGGVNVRYAMEQEGWGNPEKFPTVESVESRLTAIEKSLMDTGVALVEKAVCYRHQYKNGKWANIPALDDDEEIDCISRSWRTDWRKPNPMMLLYLMTRVDADPENTIMIGDMETDKQAARNAGVDFAWAHEFFGVSNG